MDAETFYLSVLEGVIAKLNDLEDNSGISIDVVNKLRQVFFFNYYSLDLA